MPQGVYEYGSGRVYTPLRPPQICFPVRQYFLRAGFLIVFSPLLLLYCLVVRLLRLFNRSSVRVVGLFGRGIRILCFSGGSPVCFFRKLFRVRAFRLFGVRVRSGCALVGYFSGGGIRILFFIGGSPVRLFASIFRVRGFLGGLGCRLR